MQARENSMNDRMLRRLQHIIYPPESGYQNEAGGLMENLRTLKIESSNNNKNNNNKKQNIYDDEITNKTPLSFIYSSPTISQSILQTR